MDEGLRAELLRRMGKDQAARKALEDPRPAAFLRCPGCGKPVPLSPPKGGEAFTVTCAACEHEATVRLAR